MQFRYGFVVASDRVRTDIGRGETSYRRRQGETENGSGFYHHDQYNRVCIGPNGLLFWFHYLAFNVPPRAAVSQIIYVGFISSLTWVCVENSLSCVLSTSQTSNTAIPKSCTIVAIPVVII